MSFATETIQLGVESGYAPFEIKKLDDLLAGFDIDLLIKFVNASKYSTVELRVTFSCC
jgi:ABC-type amino acid transport substrate-binding protein